VVLTDLKMPARGGLDLLAEVKKLPVPPEVVVVTAFGSVDTAVRAMRLGAYDYLTKPLEQAELLLTVERALEKYLLRREGRELRHELEQRLSTSFIAASAVMRALLDVARKMAASDATVLIRGESGTGKERVARLIHSAGARGARVMQGINCAAFPETLLEAELFGYEKGAFTGAAARKIGLIESGHGSTVFLDEVADMSLNMQAKILRVLQEKEVRRVGGTVSLTVDVRFIAATNKNLEDEIRRSTFREDLYYRLNVLPMTIPPLRERRDDIPPLVRHFLSRRGRARTITDEALQLLTAYHWPGNVRELEAVMERMMVLATSETIGATDLPPEICRPGQKDPQRACILPAEGIVFEAWEKDLLEQALAKSNGMISDAARLLGMTYRTFQYRAEKFGLLKKD
jgi:DNA-binding NtrC family response regulator